MFEINAENKKLLYLILVFIIMISLSSLKSIPIVKPEIIVKQEIIKPVSSEEILFINTNRKIVVFTFDGGGENNSINQILNVLGKFNIKSSFFLTGKWIENNPLLTVKIHNLGHEIYNHTYDHPYLTQISDEKIKFELNKMNQILNKIIGIDSRPYFRPPFGDRDERVRKVASDEGYQSVYWTVDALDWMESTGETEETVINRIIQNLKPGTIYLMHIGDNITGNILEKVFLKIESRGYKILSLTQANEEK